MSVVRAAESYGIGDASFRILCRRKSGEIRKMDNIVTDNIIAMRIFIKFELVIFTLLVDKYDYLQFIWN